VADPWTYLYLAIAQHGQVIDVWLSRRRDRSACTSAATSQCWGTSTWTFPDRPRSRGPPWGSRPGNVHPLMMADRFGAEHEDPSLDVIGDVAAMTEQPPEHLGVLGADRQDLFPSTLIED
jgi:hypothetical protein